MSTPAKVAQRSRRHAVSAGRRPAVGVITSAPLPAIGAPGSGGRANVERVCKLALEIQSADEREDLAERDAIIASQALGQIERGPLGKHHLRAAAAAVGRETAGTRARWPDALPAAAVPRYDAAPWFVLPVARSWSSPCVWFRVLSAVFFWPAHTTYYWELADSLARGRGFTLDGRPVTFMEPLYPAFLAVLKLATNDSIVASALLQAAFAAAGGVLLWRCSERLAGGRAALIATLFYAFYPYYVRQAGAWIEMSFATTLLIAAVWQYSRIENIRGAAVCGVWLGLLVLTRATFLVSVAGLFTMLVLDRHLTRALTLLVVTLGLVLPWAVRGWVIDGSLLPSRVGENLYVSTNRLSRAVGPRYDIDLLVPYAYEEIADEMPTSRPGTRMRRLGIAFFATTLSGSPRRIHSRSRG